MIRASNDAEAERALILRQDHFLQRQQKMTLVSVQRKVSLTKHRTNYCCVDLKFEKALNDGCLWTQIHIRV